MPSYRCGPLVYDGHRQVLLRDGEELALTPKTRDLLVLFLSSSGRLLTRAELVQRAWPDVAVTDNALSFQVAELRRVLGDQGGALKTIPRSGYRWEAPVDVLATPAQPLAAEAAPAAPSPPPRPAAAGRWRLAAAALAGLALLALAVLRGRSWGGGEEPPAPPVTSAAVRVAVLPLTVVGAPDPDPGLGLADLLSLRLSLLPGLAVRSTAEVLAELKPGRPATLDLARALRVDALVEGSLQPSGDVVDVRLRLLDGRSGRSLWAGEARATAGDRVAVEQRLGDELARALNLPLEQLAIERWAAPVSADVAQTYWRAQALSLRGWRASKEALRLVASVNRSDPGFAPAYTLKAQLLGLEVGYGVAQDPEENHRQALAAARLAVQLDPSSPYARSVLGGAMADMGDLDAGAAEAAAAREAAPSRPSIHMLLGWLYRWAGLLDQAERAYETAFEIDPSLWRAGTHLAYVATLKGEHAKAEATLERLRAFGATAEAAAWEMQAWRRYNLGDGAGARAACAHLTGRPEVLNYCPRLQALLAARAGDPAPARALLDKPGEERYPDGRRRFDRAALFAVLGQRERALAELQAAETYGFQAPQALRFDPDLAPLLEDARFQALLQRWEARRGRRAAAWR